VTLPEVSVVIPTRNRLQMLRQTLGSVLSQEGVIVQAIVVDEGSSDATPSWLASQDDERITVVRHDIPKRLPGARNAGLAHARYNLVAFVDDDDIWSRHKLAAQAAALHDAGAQWCITGAVHVDEDLRPVAVHQPPPGDAVYALLRRFNAVPGGGSGVLMTRELLDSVGGFREDLTAAEDWECWLRLSAAGKPVSVDRPLLAYRRLSHSMSHEMDRMLVALQRVASLHPELERDPELGVPAGTLRNLARLAREAGDWGTAVKLIWRDRRNVGTLLRAPLYLLVPIWAVKKSFYLRPGQVRWAEPLVVELRELR
jgi:glycosyltransferase involved in cell wall biosynthesis